jgi:hypothetical protein
MSYNQPGSQSSLKGSYRKRTWMFSKRQHNSDNVDNITSEVQNHVTDTNEEADVPIEPTVDDSDAESDHCGSGSRAKVTTETVADDSGDDSSSTSRSSSSSSRSSRSSSSSSSSSRSSSSSSSSSVSIHKHNDDKDDCHSSATKHVIQKVSSRIKHSVPIKLKRTKVSGLKRDPVSDPYVYNDPEHQYTEDDVCSGAVYTLSNPPKTDDTEPESAPSEATSAENQPKQPDSAAETQPKQPDTAAEIQTPETDTGKTQTQEPDTVAEIQTPETDTGAEIQTQETESAAEIQTPEPDTVAEIQTPETDTVAEIQTQETESAAEIQTLETESAAEIQTRETAYTIPNPQSTAEPGSQCLGEPCEMSCNVPECRVDNGILLAAPGYQDRAEDAVSATEDLTRSGCANSKGTESALDNIAKGYRCDRSDDEVDAALDIITCVTYVCVPGITHTHCVIVEM